MISNIPRVMIAGTSSGSGKTTVTCAILQMLVNKGLQTMSFKCGPDYIDPMFHSRIIGAGSSNLDAYLCDDNTLKYLFATNSSGSDIAVIEGVMGYYDGCMADSFRASAYNVAQIVKAPVILVVNCSGISNSAAAIIKGFAELKQDSRIGGVILNNITASTYASVKTIIEQTFNGNINVLGYLSKLPEDIILKSRHLGLVTAGEVEDIKGKLEKLAGIAEQTIDLEGIIQYAKNAESEYIEYEDIYVQSNQQRVRLAVAMDEAFCFYYKDNLELLEKMGMELVSFSPIVDKSLPADIDGVYLGGGYPEIFLEQLSENESMLASIRDKIADKMPCIAECGGFMYLSDSIDGHKMAGVIDTEAANKGKLQRFGYVELTAEYDNMLCQKGEKLKGHEFHYYDSTDNGNGFTAEKLNGTTWKCVVANEYMYAGYPHIHFYSNLGAVQNFYNKCLEYHMNK